MVDYFTQLRTENEKLRDKLKILEPIAKDAAKKLILMYDRGQCEPRCELDTLIHHYFPRRRLPTPAAPQFRERQGRA
jgi:hypothetical protein